MAFDYILVATLGPSSDDPAIWRAMLDAGATAFRLNTSHLTLPQLDEWLHKLESFLSAVAPTPPLVLDLQGSKWRLGDFESFNLTPGQTVELVYAASTDHAGVLPVPHPDLFQAAALSNGELRLNDARVRLAVESFSSQSIQARVVQGGAISARKGITFADSTFRKEALNEQDQAIVARTESLGFVRYALSFVRDAVEMALYRAQIGRSAYLIAKLERRPAVDEAKQIAEQADELWLCRGDLGAEVGIVTMAELVHRVSERVAEMGVPVLLAGQVLEHMVEHREPTRSEVCFIYDALVQGYRGFVLSDEAAIGRYPVESCRAAAMFRSPI